MRKSGRNGVGRSGTNTPDSWNPEDDLAARLGEILLQARRCATPEARESYLDQACAHDPELRAQAVSLLAGQVRWTTNVNQGRLWRLAISPDGERFVVKLPAEPKVKGHLRAIADGRLLGELVGHQGPILAVTVGPDGQRILTGAWDGTARLRSVTTGQQTGPALKHNLEVKQGNR